MTLPLFFKKLIGFGMGLGCIQQLVKSKTVVFMLHRVVDDSYYQNCRFQRSTMITDNRFRTLLRFVQNHFKIVSLSSLLQDNFATPANNQKPCAVLTFDDGWKDNYDRAFPILRSYNLPATIFLSTNYIDSDLGFWWQDLGDLLTSSNLSTSSKEKIQKYLRQTLPASDLKFDIFQECDAFIEMLKQKHYPEADHITRTLHDLANMKIINHCLSWGECRHMSAHGIEFGSHTLSHPRLSLLDNKSLDNELRLSKNVLYENKINTIDAICYPYGDYNARTLECASKYYRIGLTTNTGILPDILQTRMALPRLNIPENVVSSSAWFNYRLAKAAIKSRRRHQAIT